MATDRTHQLDMLLHQKVTGTKYQSRGMILFALHGHEPHIGSLSCFADHFGINSIVLLSFQKWLYIGRRDQSDLMPLALQFPSPVMGIIAGLHRDCACRLGREEFQHLAACESPTEQRFSSRIGAMCLKDILRDIQSDNAYLTHGCPHAGVF
jgi:hypothetical protein